jgi:hypothetical protein
VAAPRRYRAELTFVLSPFPFPPLPDNFKFSLLSQYDEPGFVGNQLAVVRYGVDESTMPDASVAGSDPGVGSGAPGDLDVSSLVPAVAKEAPNATV